MLDKHYYKSLLFDFQNYNSNILDYVLRVEKIKSVDELQSLLEKHICFSNDNNNQFIEYTEAVNGYLPVYINENNGCDYFQIVQMILAINTKYPILLDSPHAVYWNYHIYKAIGRYNRYKCINCNLVVKFNECTNCLYTTNDHVHFVSCHKKYYKQILVQFLIEKEILNNMGKWQLNHQITPKIIYDAGILKYQNRFPTLLLYRISSFPAMKSNLNKQKKLISPFQAKSIKEYFDEGFTKTLQQYCLSPTILKQFRSNLLHEIAHNSLLLTHKKLIAIWLNGIAMSGDGTFNIRPKFINPNTKQHFKDHAQVFKIYAIYKYKTKAKHKGISVIKSYLIAIGILDSKDNKIYEWVFKTLSNWAQKLNLLQNNNLSVYICDYERSQRNGVRNILSKILNLEISGEEFHYNHSILKNIGTKHLLPLYRNLKDGKKYDKTFRTIIEKLYALAHIPIKYVSEFSIKISQELLNHAHEKYDDNTDIQKNILDFIYYFLTNWCEYKKEKISKELKLTSKEKEIIDKKRNVCSFKIEEWNLYNQQIRTNNAVEVNNKHDRKAIGYYPPINKFIKFCLYKIQETIRNFNCDQKKKILPKSYINSSLKKKNKLLQQYKQKNNLYTNFNTFSSALSAIRYSNKYNYYNNTNENTVDDFPINIKNTTEEICAILNDECNIVSINDNEINCVINDTILNQITLNKNNEKKSFIESFDSEESIFNTNNNDDEKSTSNVYNDDNEKEKIRFENFLPDLTLSFVTSEVDASSFDNFVIDSLAFDNIPINKRGPKRKQFNKSIEMRVKGINIYNEFNSDDEFGYQEMQDKIEEFNQSCLKPKKHKNKKRKKKNKKRKTKKRKLN